MVLSLRVERGKGSIGVIVYRSAPEADEFFCGEPSLLTVSSLMMKSSKWADRQSVGVRRGTARTQWGDEHEDA
jgi:hypothetical protein